MVNCHRHVVASPQSHIRKYHVFFVYARRLLPRYMNSKGTKKAGSIFFYGESMNVSVENLLKEFRELQLDKQAVYAWCEAGRARVCD